MSRRVGLILVAALVLLAAVPAYAAPGPPDFSAGVYGDGEAWGTKGTTDLPAPNDHNLQSFDALYQVPTQDMPVSEAAPGNPLYNGGRWRTVAVIWDAEATPVLLTSFSADYVDDPIHSIEYQLDQGNISLDPSGATYFQCPLLPVKE
jgi:hypothetical protein